MSHGVRFRFSVLIAWTDMTDTSLRFVGTGGPAWGRSMIVALCLPRNRLAFYAFLREGSSQSLLVQFGDENARKCPFLQLAPAFFTCSSKNMIRSLPVLQSEHAG